MLLRRASSSSWHSSLTPPLWIVFALVMFLATPRWAQAGTLSNVTATPANDTTGAGTTYTISFKVQQALPPDGKIVLTFPSSFFLPEPLAASNVKNLNGGFKVSVADSVVTVTRDATGDTLRADSTGSFIIAMIVNPEKAGSYTVGVKTQKPDGSLLDTGTSASFMINAGALDHFVVTGDNGQPLGTQTAGNEFSLTITGKDAYNNDVVFSDSVSLSDNSGTLTPKKVKMSGFSLTITNAKITKAQTGVVITVTGGSKRGNSNSFTVQPGNLSKFVLSSIPSPQIAGVAFAVTVTALDADSNVVTSFHNKTINFLPNNGSFQPTVSGRFSNGTRTEYITFLKTGAGKTITADDGLGHNGTSNVFTVNPGKPSGTVTLMATPSALPVNASTGSRITSTLIRDTQGNAVGPNKLFTVSVNNSAFGMIDTVDVDVMLPGLQIRTYNSSILSFPFKAGTTGGLATILVSSVDGSASGSVNISVNELKILSIQTAPDSVSRGHANLPVNMTIQNIGADTIIIENAELTFRKGMINDSTSYAVSKPLFPKIPGHSTIKTLTFLVRVSKGARLGLININGKVNGRIGTLLSGMAISDTSAEVTDLWKVQSLPDIFYDPEPARLRGLWPIKVSIGTSYKFSVPVQNGKSSSGQATVILNPDSTTFQFDDGANHTFVAKLDANHGTKIPGDRAETILTFRLEQIPPFMFKGVYTPRVKLIGTQNSVRFTHEFSTAPDNIIVEEAPPLQIVEITSSQDAVTQGMTKPWTITLQVRNNTSSAVELNSDSTNLKLVKAGAGVDTTYHITKPEQFFAIGKVLAPSGQGNLVFQIDTTGKQFGVMAVYANVVVKDLSTGENIFAESNGTQKSILVQSRAKLKVALRTSQPTVTRHQSQPWQITMAVSNKGESDAAVILLANLTRVQVGNETDYFIAPPAKADTIRGNSTRDLIFTVNKTGETMATLPIHGQVYARELNSDTLRFDDTTDGDSAFVTVQSPAEVSIGSALLTQVFNTDSLSGVDTVNVRQKFQMRVKIKKNGEEKVDSMWVSLVSRDGSALISPNKIALPDTSQLAIFNVTTGNNPNTLFLTALIDSARSGNTRINSIRLGVPSTKSKTLIVQNPAVLKIQSVKASEEKVRYGQSQPWYISVPIINNGEASLVLTSAQAAAKINNVLQTDYIFAIQDSAKKFGKTLYTGGKDTLIFKVTKTGTTGGTATITVTVSGRDKNNNELRADSQSTTVVVETTALVKVTTTTFPAAVNRVTGSDIALVNTSQIFNIEVTVENTGGLETVDTVWVSLSTRGKSILLTKQAKTRRKLGTQNDTAKVSFSVLATSTPDSLGEKFSAKIDSAKTSFVHASIGRAGDDTAVVRIERPARLQLNAATDATENLLTTQQHFTVWALVKNLGQAKTDNSGRLQIVPPDTGYKVLESLGKSFTIGDTLKWRVRAPLRESFQDSFRVMITSRPRDKNSGDFAQIVNTVATVVVNTYSSLLAIDSIFVVDPPGARDRVVSTEQLFTVAATITTSSNLTDKTATLTLPSDYSFGSGQDSTKVIPSNGRVSWEIQAPNEAHSTPVRLKMKAKAFDGQRQPIERQSTLALTTQKRAILQLQARISEPSGAQAGTLSTGQYFTIAATVTNTGEAAIYDTTVVILDLGKTGVTTGSDKRKEIVFGSGSSVETVTWLAQAPEVPTPPAQLTFVINRTSRDQNTNKPALLANNSFPLNLTTVARGSLSGGALRILAPSGATDYVVSTEQSFVMSDSITWRNANRVTARLILPPGLGFIADNTVQTLTTTGGSGEAQLFWRVIAPVEPVASAELSVLIQAQDAHNDTLSLAPVSEVINVSVVPRADLQLNAFISQPASALDGVVTAGQPFEVTAVIENPGGASVYDTACVRLSFEPPNLGYTLFDPPEKTVVFPGPQALTWRIRARQDISAETDHIKFTLVRAPLDTNSNQPAKISSSIAQLTIRTEGKRLVVEELATGGRPPSMRGEKGLLLLRLKLTNPASSGSSSLVLQALRFSLRDRNNRDVAPNTALKAIRVVNDLQRSRVRGQIATMPPNNPVQVSLSDSVVVSPNKPDTVAIVVDVTDVATPGKSNFRLVIDHGQDFAIVDQDSGSVVLVEDGSGRRGQDFQIESELTVLYESDPRESFGNYPNPFRPGKNKLRGEGTHFTYHLPEASDGELMIYTLLGELVWETSFSATDAAGKAGFHDTDLFWHGFNGAGKKVLNGVYVAILKTKFGKFMTKVAVVK